MSCLDPENGDDSDEDESNANLSNEEARAEVVIASSPAAAFSHNELRKYTATMGMSGAASNDNSVNGSVSNRQSHLRQSIGFSAVDSDSRLDSSTPPQML